MIASLTGKVLLSDNDSLVISVGNVGYRVYCPHSILKRLSAGEQEITLFTYPYIRDDRFDLFGFLSVEDLNLFKLMISVSGVGPKTGLLIFGAGGSESIKKALSQSDVSFFSDVPGVGKKTAQKIVLELRDKVGALDDSLETILENKEDEEVVLALKQLGYKAAEIREAVKNLDRSASSSTKIKEALRVLGNL